MPFLMFLHDVSLWSYRSKSSCLFCRPSTRYTWCTTKRRRVMWLVTSSTFSASWRRSWRSHISTSAPRSVSRRWIRSCRWQYSIIMGCRTLAPEPMILILEASMLLLKSEGTYKLLGFPVTTMPAVTIFSNRVNLTSRDARQKKLRLTGGGTAALWHWSRACWHTFPSPMVCADWPVMMSTVSVRLPSETTIRHQWSIKWHGDICLPKSP